MEEHDELDLQLSADVYDAVLAASFGGVIVSLPLEEPEEGKDKAKARTITIHPILVFGIASLLFFIQITCMTCLILDVDFKKPWSTSTWEEFDKTPGRRILLCSKMLMVIILQMICIKEFLSGMKPLAFILNPVTWEEVHRPSRTSPALFHWRLCFPFCLVAQCMQLIIAYFVATSSMTIILQSTKVTEVVFNGLVITFLTDLDEYMFTAAAAVFHVDIRKYTDFKFRFTDHKEVNARRREAIQDHKKDVDKWIYQREYKSWNIYRYRGRGGKVKVVENICVFCFLGCLFFRQTMVFTQAIETGILPLRRDFCTLYRGLDGLLVKTSEGVKGDTAGAVAVFVMDHLTLLDYRHSLANCAKRFDLDDCYDVAMKPLVMSETIVDYFHYYPKYLTVATVCLLFTFLVPQILFANLDRILKWRVYWALEDAGGAQEKEQEYKALEKGEDKEAQPS